jgi:hypothetical protein
MKLSCIITLSVAAIIPLLLTGCGKAQDSLQARVNDAILVCRDHVEYIYMTNSYGGSITPHLKTDGKPYNC